MAMRQLGQTCLAAFNRRYRRAGTPPDGRGARSPSQNAFEFMRPVFRTLAAFATRLVGMACEASGIDQWLTPFRSKRRLCSVMRLGREALERRWSNVRLGDLVDQLRHPHTVLLDRLGCQHEQRGEPSDSVSV